MNNHQSNGTHSGETPTRFETEAGAFTARDHRVFHRRNRAFCERLVRAALDQPDVALARVGLDDRAFRIEFARETISPSEMADRFAAAVKSALAPAEGNGDCPWDWDMLTGLQRPEGPSVWAAAHDGRGIVRLWSEPLRAEREGVRRVAETLRTAAGIRACRVLRNGGLRVRYDARRVGSPGIVATAAAIWAERPEPIAGDSGLRRLGYLVLAGGSFVVTVVAVAVPGVPTVPMLLLTSYYLARSSPALNRRLLRSRLFGPILRDWSEHRALRWSSKRKLLLLSLATFGISLVVFAPPVGVTTVIVVIAAATLYSILRFPEIPEDTPGPADHAPVPDHEPVPAFAV